MYNIRYVSYRTCILYMLWLSHITLKSQHPCMVDTMFKYRWFYDNESAIV